MLERINTEKLPLRTPGWIHRMKGMGISEALKSAVIKKRSLEFGWIYWFFIALFIGRASLLGEVMPFALIFWAVVLRTSRQWKNAVTLGILAGWLTVDTGAFPPWVLPATMLLWRLLDGVLTLLWRRKLSLSLTLPLAIVLVRLPLFYFISFNSYKLFITGLEVALAVLLPSLLLPLLESVQLRKNSRPAPEIVVGMGLILFLVLLGMTDIFLHENIAVVNIVAPLLVLTGAYLWGPFWGVAGGVVVGLCISFHNPAMLPFSGTLGIAGLVAGVLRNQRRFWVAGGYLLALRFLAYYALEGGFIFTHLWEELVVVALFLAVPRSSWDKTEQLSGFLPYRPEDEERLRFSMATRVKDFAAVFKELAETFRPLQQVDGDHGCGDLSPLVDYFSRRVCNACEYFNRCWHTDLFNQYRRVVTMLAEVEKGGNFSEKMIPVKLRRYCPRQREMVRTMGNMREIYRLHSFWEEKLQQGRVLVSQQLEGIAALMHDLAQEIKLQTGDGEESQLSETVLYALEIGVAQVAREGQSVTGDSYAVLPLKEGRQAILLSDGMGSGKEARQASRSTVKLMERLLAAGLRQDVILNTINTLLRLRYPSEKFATLDMAMLDSRSGDLDLYKLGAPPSFLKNGGATKVVGSGSLPIGILEEIAPEKHHFKLEHGGTLVMVTDGLLENAAGYEDGWLVDTLNEIRHDHPQIIADRLIEEACYRRPRGVQDDLTVLVGRFRPIN
ncbi:MAG: SpoIIE family protein phosphatase [Bacillota bacterium]